MTERAKDVGASVRARLLALARQREEDYQSLLTRYANERFLYRLSVSPHESRFVLKGAMLLAVWTTEPHRATRDVDLLGLGDSSEAHIRKMFRETIAFEVEDDGVTFDPGSLEVGPIREDQVYGGIRCFVLARIAGARVRLQIDVGFGDVITPAASTADIPVLLDFPRPRLRVYPRETVVAEKVEAMVRFGLANSRMKDFYDLYLISRLFEFRGELLVRAVRATFDRRRTPLPDGQPAALTSEFADDQGKTTQWNAFLRKSDLSETVDLARAIGEISMFVSRPLRVAASQQEWQGFWPPGGPWRDNDKR